MELNYEFQDLFSEDEINEASARWSTGDIMSLVEEADQAPPQDGRVDQPGGRNLSLDLSEATYNMPFNLLVRQHEFFGEILEGFPVWDAFSDLFAIFGREIDMAPLKEKGVWDGPETVVSTCGSFMGDVMSFLHLSTMLRATSLYSAKGASVLGQSVGDDLLAIGVSPDFCQRFVTQINSLGGSISKFNSTSEDSLTFCESYAAKIIDRDKHGDYPAGSVFGDIYFLDIIKGSTLSAKSKVNSTGSDPFWGHAAMLNKQVAWHPIEWVRTRATKLLWAANYWRAKKLSGSFATLPRSLGGCDLAIGRRIGFFDPIFQSELLPWYAALLNAKDDRVFLAFYTLLQGIFKANPKGLPYSNSSELVFKVLSNLWTKRVGRLADLLPSYMHKMPIAVQLRFLSKELDMANVSWLVDEIARREAFARYWKQETNPTFMTLPARAPRERWKRVWEEIKRNFDPAPCRFRNMDELVSRFETRVWNVFFSKDDPAIADALGGCPSLFIDFSDAIYAI